MNIKEKLTCKYCTDVYDKPITLNCCGENICKQHIDELISNSSSNKFTCPFCNETNANHFKINKLLQSFVEIELHEFKIDPVYEAVLDNLKHEIANLETILNDPENFIYEEISEFKRQVDLDRENLKSQIDTLADDLISILESYAKMFKAEYKTKIDLEHYNGLVASSKKQLAEYEQCLSLFSTKNEERYVRRIESEKIIKQLQPKIKEFKQKLFTNLSFSYEPKENNVKDLFGDLKISESQKFNIEKFSGKLRKTIAGHMDSVYALAVLSNGDLISCSYDTVKIWNVADWTIKQRYNNHADGLGDILVLDDTFFINSFDDFTINVSNINDGSLKRKLIGHTGAVRALVFLKNGDLASGSSDKTIKIWNLEDGTLKKTLKGHTKAVWKLVLLKNGDLASGSDDYTIKIWDADSGLVKITLAGHTSEIDALTLLENGDLVSGSNDQTIKIWNVEDGTVKQTLTGHTNRVFALKVLNNGDLVSGSWDSTVKIWNIEDGIILHDINLNSEVNSLEVLQNSDLVIGCLDGSIQIFN